ncbi:MAG TPA: hypothetical protein VFV19_13065 [Candidatus Polarisedimenticolaceae bacterium]|nr:hypothetical protein [Candidatus Polarisedimenticolaceae bacterium]
MLKHPTVPVFFLGLALALAPGSPAPRAAEEADGPPVKIAVSVSPTAVTAGGDAKATFQLTPNPGIKLNKYPKIKIRIPESAGLVSAAEASIGNPAPPAADNLDANYYHGAVDPLAVTVHLDAAAAKGKHDLQGELRYFYCVAASGYCAPAKVAVTIPVTVR